MSLAWALRAATVTHCRHVRRDRRRVAAHERQRELGAGCWGLASFMAAVGRQQAGVQRRYVGAAVHSTAQQRRVVLPWSQGGAR